MYTQCVVHSGTIFTFCIFLKWFPGFGNIVRKTNDLLDLLFRTLHGSLRTHIKNNKKFTQTQSQSIHSDIKIQFIQTYRYNSFRHTDTIHSDIKIQFIQTYRYNSFRYTDTINSDIEIQFI